MSVPVGTVPLQFAGVPDMLPLVVPDQFCVAAWAEERRRSRQQAVDSRQRKKESRESSRDGSAEDFEFFIMLFSSVFWWGDVFILWVFSAEVGGVARWIM